jgi:hypothetical protein
LTLDSLFTPAGGPFCQKHYLKVYSSSGLISEFVGYFFPSGSILPEKKDE